MNNERWNIIAKFINGETLDKSEHEYINKAQADGRLNKLIEESKSINNQAIQYYQLQQFNTQVAWDKLNQKTLESKPTRFIYRKLIGYAAIFILLLASTFGIWHIAEQSRYQIIKTSKEETQQLVHILPDGTMVQLHYGTSIKFPKKFDKQNRIVELSGEAFFEVVANAQKPFIVETNGASVKVLGTSFNVSAYENQSLVEVIVKTGRVELKQNNKNEQRGLMLAAGEKGSFNKASNNIKKVAQFNNNELSWITREIEFNFSALNDVVSTLEHTYGIRIDVENDVDLNQVITATFNQQKPKYILGVVALTLNLEIQISDHNTYVIKNK